MFVNRVRIRQGLLRNFKFHGPCTQGQFVNLALFEKLIEELEPSSAKYNAHDFWIIFENKLGRIQ